jgi:hypothetical protein
MYVESRGGGGRKERGRWTPLQVRQGPKHAARRHSEFTNFCPSLQQAMHVRSALSARRRERLGEGGASREGGSAGAAAEGWRRPLD